MAASRIPPSAAAIRGELARVRAAEALTYMKEGDSLGDGDAHDGLGEPKPGVGNDGPGLGLAEGAARAAITVAPAATTSATRANDVRSLLMVLHLTIKIGDGASLGRYPAPKHSFTERKSPVVASMA